MTDDEAAEALLAVLKAIHRRLNEAAPVVKRQENAWAYCPPELRWNYRGEE